MATFRVLIVDDHPVVLSGLRMLLSLDPCYAICAEATTTVAAREAADRHRPDVIVTDLVLGRADGTELIEDLAVAAPDARIIVYSSQEETLWARLALRAGARGYVSKAEPLDAVARALDVVLSGEVHVSLAVQRLLARDAASPNQLFDLAALSPRELQILRLMSEGLSLQVLGAELRLSVKTVGTYRERLKTKLGFDSVRTLERFAIEQARGRTTLP